jgi:hypothetical protein
VHQHGDPMYGEPAGNLCVPTCAKCPNGYKCTDRGQRLCDYDPGAASAAGDAGVDLLDGALPTGDH